mgnify:CR=1 FL=1
MQSANDLKQLLLSINHKSYPAYKSTRGAYQFPRYTLSIDHVQGDPFAAPSRVSVHVSGKTAAFPAFLYDTYEKRVALQDYLLRQFARAIAPYSFRAKGSGKSGLLGISRCGQEILERMGWKFYRIWSTDWFRNKSVEQLRLLEAAADAVKNPAKAEVEPVDSQPTETFEEVTVEKHFEFPAYKAVDFFEVCRRHHHSDFKAIVKEILEVEAPLSEDLFLKRIVWYFDREKVTSGVQRAYEQQMYGCQRYGIIRRNGFLYLDNGKEIPFRGLGDVERDIRQIAPEELAAGMFEILKQNVTADKSGLYRSLAAQCGVTRVGKTINEAMDAALNLLSNRIVIDGEQISIK